MPVFCRESAQARSCLEILSVFDFKSEISDLKSEISGKRSSNNTSIECRPPSHARCRETSAVPASCRAQILRQCYSRWRLQHSLIDCACQHAHENMAWPREQTFERLARLHPSRRAGLRNGCISLWKTSQAEFG